MDDAIAQFLLLLYSLSLTVAMLLKLATFVSTFPQWGKLLSKMEQSCFYYLCNFLHCTGVLFTSFRLGGFITARVVNPPERKLAKGTSVHCRILVDLSGLFYNIMP